MKPFTGTEYDDKIQSLFFGFKNAKDYHKNGTCYERIPSILVPTLFINSLDDTVIVK